MTAPDDFQPSISELASFKLKEPDKTEKVRPADQAAGCLWGTAPNEYREPVGTTKCIAGSIFKCAADGTWENQFQSCQG